jgi:hypothetical protein
MGNNLFVTGFPYETTEAQLQQLFSSCGTVLGAKILVERVTGRSRGMGFVLMSTDAEAQTAIVKLNGSTLGPRKIFVNEARPAERSEAPAYTGPERRSGKDRRRSPPAAAAPAAEQRRPWQRKPWGQDGKPASGGEKPWGKKSWPKDQKPGFGGGKPWKKKPWAGDAKPAKKPWERKPWDAMYEGKKREGPRPKKGWGAGGPGGGRRPGDFKSRPGGFKRKPGGGFRG